MANKRWSSDEEKLLLSLVKSRTHDECAKELERTTYAVFCRLEKIALAMYVEGKPIDEIHTDTMLPIANIQKLAHLHDLPNHKADWDPSQDVWLRKYVGKLGVAACASKMGRADSEIETRRTALAIDEVLSAQIPIKKVTKTFGLQRETFEAHLTLMEDCVPLDKVGGDPPYYVVLNGRRTGVYAEAEGFRMATIGFENAKYKKCTTIDDFHKYIGKPVAPAPAPPPPPPPSLETVVLSDEQQAVIGAVETGKNILMLGSAGVGKSLVIKHITRMCDVREINIGIAATTGCAAVLIDGRTIHSFLGIGLAKDSPMALASNLAYRNKAKCDMLKTLRILLIDEISMLDANLLEKISKFLSCVRSNFNKPFGGIQVIFSGDFYQLAPVSGLYAFESSIWEKINMSCHILTKIYRQEGDLLFQSILERAKTSSVTEEDIQILTECKGQDFKTGMKPTSLFAKNVTVDVVNKEKYALLEGNEMAYNTFYANKESKAYCENIGIPSVLKLKVGAQVMVTRNISANMKLANGTRGVVREMHKDHVVIQTLYGDRPIARFECVNENDRKIQYSAMPLILAWAITIHKAQGVTLDCCSIDIGKSLFACGQAYTALSRVKDLKGLCVINIDKAGFKTDPKVVDFYNAIQNKN